MIGIYKYTNKINGQSYIGQSINIEKRRISHEQRAFCSSEKNKEYNKAFYCALRKYGLENFTFEILKTCSKEELNDWEMYYIKKYDTLNNGYNETAGGDMFLKEHDGEKHPRHKLTEKEVYNIRESYANHEIKEEVYELYKDKIGKSGFHKVWNGDTWTKIHMDVYTKENRDFHTLVRNSHPGKGTGRRLSINEIREIRKRKKDGESFEQIYEDFKNKATKKVFLQIYEGKTYEFIQ